MTTYNIDDLPHELSEGDIVVARSASNKKLSLPKGKYLIEAYGAKGAGAAENRGGRGAYCKGILELDNSLDFLLNISGSSELKLNDSPKSRIMVAGSGGGEGLWSRTPNVVIRVVSGGDAGLVGSTGGAHSAGSASGKGGRGGSQTQNGSGYSGGGAGGRGYYNGGPGYANWVSSDTIRNGGGGGSSFISGHPGCNSVDENGNHTNQPYHYSGLYFEDTLIQTHTNTLPEIRITVLSLFSSCAIIANEKGYAFSSDTVKEFSFSMDNFEKYSMSTNGLSKIDFFKLFKKKHYINNTPSQMGSGKLFEQPLDNDKKIISIISKGKTLVTSNEVRYYYRDEQWNSVSGSEEDFVNYGMDPATLSSVPINAWKEFPSITLSCYEDSLDLESLTIETEVEPFTIYDEFGDSMEVLYYTDDTDKEDAELHITANYSPLDEFDDFSVVTWRDDTENLSLKIAFEKEPKQICVQTDTLSISSLTTSIVYTGSSDIKVLISFDNGLIYRHPVTFEEVTIPDYIDSEKQPINITQYKQEEINTLYKQAGLLTDLNTSDFLEKAIQEGSFQGLFILGEEDAFLDKIEITTASEVKNSPAVELYEIEYYVVKA